MPSFTNALLLLTLSYTAVAQILVGTQQTGQYPIGSLVTTTFTGADPPSIIQLCLTNNLNFLNPVLTISSNAESSPVSWKVPSPPLVNCVDQYLVIIHDATGLIGESTSFTFTGCPSNTTTAASSTCPTPTATPASTLTLTSTKTVSTCSASTLTTTASVTEVITVTSTVPETGRFRDTITETVTDTEHDKVTTTITEVVTDFQRQHTTVTQWITDTRFQFTTVTVVETATATRRPNRFTG